MALTATQLCPEAASDHRGGSGGFLLDRHEAVAVIAWRRCRKAPPRAGRVERLCPLQLQIWGVTPIMGANERIRIPSRRAEAYIACTTGPFERK